MGPMAIEVWHFHTETGVIFEEDKENGDDVDDEFEEDEEEKDDGTEERGTKDVAEEDPMEAATEEGEGDGERE